MDDLDKTLQEIKKHIDNKADVARTDGTGKALTTAQVNDMNDKMDQIRKLIAEGDEIKARMEGKTAAPYMRRRPNFFVMMILFLAGLGCLWVGGKMTQDNLDLLDKGITAQGKVLRVETRESSCNRGSHQNKCTKYVAIVGFTDGDGRPEEFETDYRSSKPVYSEGQDVEVIFIPDHPAATAKINTTAYMWTVPGALGAGGLLLTVFPVLLLRNMRKERERIL